MSFASNEIVVRNYKYSTVFAELQLYFFCSIHVYHAIALWRMLSKKGQATAQNGGCMPFSPAQILSLV